MLPAAPHGIAHVPGSERMLVACAGSGQVVDLDTATRRVRGHLDLFDDPLGPRPSLRELAVSPDGSTAVLPRWLGSDDQGLVYILDVAELTLRETVSLAKDPGPDTNFSGRGVPNTLSGVAFSPDGRRVAVPGSKPNIDRGLARDGRALDPDNTVRTLIAQLDLGQGEIPEVRLDLDDHEGAVAATYGPWGDLLFIVTRGSNRVDVHDAFSGLKVGGFAAGLAPEDIALDDEGRAWVHDTLDRTLTVVDVSGLLDGTDAASPAIATQPALTEEPLSPELLLGKRLFHNASARDLSQDGYISCATCHPDGGHDGRTWDFTDRGEGVRNTTDLRGRAGTAHGPVHWTGNFDEIQDFENDIRLHFGGAGLMSDTDFADGRQDPLGAPKAGLSERLDALAAYVTSLDTFPRSPHRDEDGGWTEDGLRGRAIFDRLGCADCHAGDILTDSPDRERHDVGTLTDASGQRLGGPLDGIDTPTLHGLHASAPYLHDGSAATVREVLDNEAHMGTRLSDRQKDRLAAFLLQLEGGALPDGRSGCACDSGGGPGGLWVLGVGLLARRRRR